MNVAAFARLVATIVVLVGLPLPGSAQDMIDFTGDWAARIHEDQIDRVPGAELGDYLGLPINAAARQKALTWDATVLSQQERQAQPHPAQYSSRGPGPNLRITRILDPESERVIGYHFAGYYGRADRTVWMDGRSHPSERYGEHTWQGFSTGVWVGGKLVVTTTHMKMGVLQRNGVPSSPYARMIEIYARHDDYLTMVNWLDDPIYLDEPMVRSQSWALSLNQNIVKGPPFEPVEEFVDKERGYVPTRPIGNRYPEFAREFGVPEEAALGGRMTMYPEYQLRIRELMKTPVATGEGRVP